MAHKIFFLTVIIINLLAPKSLMAAPCYGTHTPAKRKWFAGAEYNFVIERKLGHNQGRIRSPNQLLMLSYGVLDWLSIDLKGGSGKITYKDSEYADQDFSTSFAGGYGFRIRLWENKNKGLKIVSGFQHISVHPRGVDTRDGKYTLVVDEWQGSCLGSIRIKQLDPYLGFKYETYDLIRWINSAHRKRYKSEDNWGLVLGTDFWLNKNLKINLECHLLDEKAASISVGFDF